MGKLLNEYERVLSLSGVTEDQKTGMLLELAVDIALTNLDIPHESNPFDSSFNSPNLVDSGNVRRVLNESVVQANASYLCRS